MDTGSETSDQGQPRSVPTAESCAIAAIGYLPMLFVVPLLIGRDDSFVRFHGRQSMLLFAAFAAIWTAIWLFGLVFGRVFGSILLLGFVFRSIDWVVHNVVGSVVSLTYIALTGVCLVQAALGRKWRVPLIGNHAGRLVSM